MIDNLIYSRLQHRRGTRRDLPQPLLPGEFGFCTDTRQLFIGSDPTDTTSSLIPTLRLYNDYYQTFKYGIDNNIEGTSAQQVIDIIYKILRGDGVDGSEFETPRVIRVETLTLPPGSNDRYNPVNSTYGYLSLASLPYTGPAFEIYPGPPLDQLTFFAGEMKLTEVGYTHEDASAIAKAINHVAYIYSDALDPSNPESEFYGKGVVTTALNVEVSIKDTNNYEEYLGTVELGLEHSGQTQWSPMLPFLSTGMVIDNSEVDTLMIKYSIHGTDGVSTVYRRVGELTILYTGTDFLVDDQYTESNMVGADPGEDELVINFTVNQITGSLDYRMYGTSPAGAVYKMRMNTLKWRSF